MQDFATAKAWSVNTVEPSNKGQVWDECFVHCSEVVPSSEVEMYGQYIGRGVNSVSIVGRLSTVQGVHCIRGSTLDYPNPILSPSLSVSRIISGA